MSKQRHNVFVSALVMVAMLANLLATPATSVAASTAPALPAGFATDTWAFQFGTSGNDSADDLTVAPNGHIIMSGHTNGDLAGTNAGRRDLWVAAFNEQGQRVWIHQYGDVADEVPVALAVDDDSNIYLSVVSKLDSKTNSLLLSLNSAGEERWRIETPDAYAMGLVVDQSVVYWAGTNQGLEQDTDQRAISSFVTATDLNGTVLWNRLIQDEPAVAVTGVAVNGDSIAVVGAKLLRHSSESGAASELLSGKMWAATLSLDGQQIQIDPTDTLADEIYLMGPEEYLSAPTDVVGTHQSGGFTMVGIGQAIDRGAIGAQFGETISWFANRFSSEDDLWRVNEFKTGAGQTGVRGILQTQPGAFLVSGIERLGSSADESSAWIAQTDDSGYFDWLTSFGTGVSNITPPAVDASGYVYIGGGTLGDMAGSNLGSSDIWLARIALNGLGLPELSEGGQRAEPPTATARYETLAGTIVFLANLEVTDDTSSPGFLPHYTYAIQPNGNGLSRISQHPLQPWAGAAVSGDGKYIALSTATSASDVEPKPIQIVDSTGKTVFTTAHPPGKRAHPLSWSPDGNTVLYLIFQDTPDGVPDQVLYALDIPSLSWTQLTVLDEVSDFDAVWTPDSQQILYESAGIRIMNRDGSGSRELISDSALGSPRRLALSPDGSTIATQPSTTVEGAGGWDIWLANTDGTNARNLTDTPDWDEENPAWSPDGRFVLYNGWPKSGGRSRIFIHDIDTGERRVLFETGNSVEPQWLPGIASPQYVLQSSVSDLPWLQEEIAFIYDDALWLKRADGQKMTLLADPDSVGPISGYSWAPDGSALAFVSQTGLWRVQIADGALQQLVDRKPLGEITQVAWSPDGNSLAVIAEDDLDGPGLSIISADGLTYRRLLGKVDGLIAWAGPLLVLLYRTEGNSEEYVAYESKLKVIDPRVDPPGELTISDAWEMPFTEPGSHRYLEISQDQQWIIFNDMGVAGAASVSGTPVQNAPGGFWKGAQPIISFTRYDRSLRASKLFEFDPATGAERDLGSLANLARFSPDGQLAALSTENLNLRQPDGAITTLSTHRAGDFLWSPSGTAILYRRLIERPDKITGSMHMRNEWTNQAGIFVIGIDGADERLLLPSSANAVTWRPRLAGEWVTLDPPLVAPDGAYTLRIRTSSSALLSKPWELFGERFANAESLADASITDIELKFNDSLVIDPGEIRRILYLYVAAYHLYQSPVSYFGDLDQIDQDLDAVLNNPLLMVPGLGSILQNESVRSRQAWRAVLGKVGASSDLKGLITYLANELDGAASVGEAALLAAKHSDKVWVQEIALRMFGQLQDWKIAEQTLTIKSAKIPVPANGWLTLASLLVEIYAVDYLSVENVKLLEHYADLVADTPYAFDPEQMSAINDIKKEIHDVTGQRGDVLADYFIEGLADVLTMGGATILVGFASWTAERTGAQSVSIFLTANMGQIVTGGLLGFSVGGFLMGLDELYDQFMLASRINELRKGIKQERVRTEQLAADGANLYSTTYADAYRTSLRLEMLASAQVRSSYINGVGATVKRGILSPIYLVDQMQGGIREQAIQDLQNDTQTQLNKFDLVFVHRPALETLVNLAVQRTQYAVMFQTSQALPDYLGIDVDSFGIETQYQGIVNADPLNLRSTPSTDSAVIDQLPEGLSLTILEHSADGQWLHVRLGDGREGWVFAEFVTLSASPGAETTQLDTEDAPCSPAAEGAISARWSRDSMGCPTGGAFHTWGAWQTFERGAMLWREDQKSIYVLGIDGHWQVVDDTWAGSAMTERRGTAPAGTQAPRNGFGFIWESDDAVFSRLGWATADERGTCLLLQPFEQGIMVKSVGSGCNNGLYSFGQESGFSLQYLILRYDSFWSQ